MQACNHFPSKDGDNMAQVLMAVAVLFILLLLLKSKLSSVPKENISNVSEAKALMDSGKIQVLDVRSDSERRQGRLQPSMHIPLDRLSKEMGKLDKEKLVLVYCASGNRSAMALNMLKRAGFSQVKHLEGGLSAWISAGNQVAR
jgi:rhodanese-related sulfurtransferase